MTSRADWMHERSDGPLGANPLSPILELGNRSRRAGALLGVLGALLSHGAIAAQAAHTLGAVRAYTVEIREQIKERLHQQFDVDLTPPPPPPPVPTHEPEPPEQKAPPPPPAAANSPPPPPPAAAEAGKILAQEQDPNEPVDMTADAFMTGNADGFRGGVTSSTGTSKTAVRDTRAQPEGVGKAPPGPVATAASAADLSKPAAPVKDSWNDCGFPPEADVEDINSAVVQLVVTVGPDSLPKAVTITRDPGNGFGKQARSCAFRHQFSAGVDKNGHPVAGTTAPFTVRFNR